MSQLSELRVMWSIGIFEGDAPTRLSTPAGLVNPVLTAGDVTDSPAEFVADPFIVLEGRAWYMFFEVMNRVTAKGEIGLASSEDGRRWSYARIVLREPFHLSYPCVFKWQDEYYMIPETLGAEGIYLYKAIVFPGDWIRTAELVRGRYADPSVFRFEDRWWIFACPKPDSRNDSLDLYFSESGLDGRWEPHPGNPVIHDNPRMARPAGRVIEWEGRTLRFAQDCDPFYGMQVRALAIHKLSPGDYEEQEIQESPILSPGNEAWRRDGMHHVDPIRTPGGLWRAAVDGWHRETGTEPQITSRRDKGH